MLPCLFTLLFWLRADWPTNGLHHSMTLLRVWSSKVDALTAPVLLRFAEWLRFAFHDMSTHNVNDGTGGLDSSIAYELGRPEVFNPLALPQRSDLIALGAVLGVATCGGPIVPFRSGRMDVYTAGPTGTPEPQQDLATHTQMFKNQGFNSSEMIALIACGHTLGGVRAADFPQLVPNGGDTSTPDFKMFDSSFKSFDNKVVTEYLDGSTQNPLVVASNVTMRSDERIFASDGNATMKTLSSPDTFSAQCGSIFERMINTVASNVTLGSEITLLPAKVQGAQLVIEKGQLVFKASLRLTQPANGTVSSTRTVTMLWCDSRGTAASCKGLTRTAVSAQKTQDDPSNISPLTTRQGLTFITYTFVVPIDASQSIGRFWFQVDEGSAGGGTKTTYDNGGNGYILDQDEALFMPMMSKMVLKDTAKTKRGGDISQNLTRELTIIVGVRNTSTPTTVSIKTFSSAFTSYAAPTTQTLTLSPAPDSVPPAAGYKFYTTTFDDAGFQVSFDLSADISGKTYTQEFRETGVLDGTPYVKPAEVKVVQGGNGPNANAGVQSDVGRSWLLALVISWIVIAW
ncbi:heme peroxidase [Infundibulicybe gibba]|nr:heme peroxidase [Infundibulicybe gibba]